MKDNAILFANESGCSIISARLNFNDSNLNARMTGDWLNTRRFVPYDIDDEKDPFLNGVNGMTVHGKRSSLNEILNSLKDDGIGYSDAQIYKVIFSKEMLGMAQKGDCKLIQFISVEATSNVFKDEPVITVYLRDMTNYVKAIKHELKSDKNRMKNEYAKKIEDTLVDLTRGKDAPTDVAGMKALI